MSDTGDRTKISAQEIANAINEPVTVTMADGTKQAAQPIMYQISQKKLDELIAEAVHRERETRAPCPACVAALAVAEAAEAARGGPPNSACDEEMMRTRARLLRERDRALKVYRRTRVHARLCRNAAGRMGAQRETATEAAAKISDRHAAECTEAARRLLKIGREDLAAVADLQARAHRQIAEEVRALKVTE